MQPSVMETVKYKMHELKKMPHTTRRTNHRSRK